jgi:hypothetical protein
VPWRLGTNSPRESIQGKLGRVYDAAKLAQFPRKSRHSKPDVMSFIFALVSQPPRQEDFGCSAFQQPESDHRFVQICVRFF